jgi:nicotinate-nucleotide adenylyltransferase
MPLTSRGRVGIFGGTFDPIHVGHLILAQEACFQLQLDCVYFVPAGDPPHKQERDVSWVEHRIRMAELATAEVDEFLVSRVEADRPGPHYTVDTVRLLQAELGATQLYFLMGMDSLRDLPTWRNPQWLIQQCKLVVLTRPDITLDWEVLEAALPGLRPQVILLDMPALEISSTALRQRIRTGGPIRHQTPRVVEAYIRKYRLYQAEDIRKTNK